MIHRIPDSGGAGCPQPAVVVPRSPLATQRRLEDQAPHLWNTQLIALPRTSGCLRLTGGTESWKGPVVSPPNRGTFPHGATARSPQRPRLHASSPVSRLRHPDLHREESGAGRNPLDPSYSRFGWGGLSSTRRRGAAKPTGYTMALGGPSAPPSTVSSLPFPAGQEV